MSVGKVMAFFFNAEGVIMKDFLETGKTINEWYYTLELRQLKEAIKLKHRGKLRAGVFLLYDNMPIHTAQVTETEIANCSFELPPIPFTHQN